MEHTLHYETSFEISFEQPDESIDESDDNMFEMYIYFTVTSQDRASDIITNYADRTSGDIPLSKTNMSLDVKDEKVSVKLTDIDFGTEDWSSREYDEISLKFVYDLNFKDDVLKQSRGDFLDNIMPKVLNRLHLGVQNVLKHLLKENMEDDLGSKVASDKLKYFTAHATRIIHKTSTDTITGYIYTSFYDEDEFSIDYPKWKERQRKRKKDKERQEEKRKKDKGPIAGRTRSKLQVTLKF